MTLTLELTNEEAERLEAAAQERGEEIDVVLHDLISHLPAPATPMSPAQAVAYWEREGVLGPWRGEKDSVELAQELRRQTEMREHSS